MSIVSGRAIPEDKGIQQQSTAGRMGLMTDEQRLRGSYFAQLYAQRRAEVDGISDKLGWDEIWKAYRCERDPDPYDESYPCSFIPLITPVVEGQAAHMSANDTEFNFVTDNPAHEGYMRKLDAADSFMRRQGTFMLEMKDFIRSYLAIGGAWLTVEWRKSYGLGKNKPDGYARAVNLPVEDVLVDGRIKDYKDIQDAEYIIHEIGFVPILWARKEYGDDLADALQAGTSRQGKGENETTDDANSFKLLHVWTRHPDTGNLQLIEMDEGGLVLRESDKDKPYYKYFNNEYPFKFARGMLIPGSMYGFGDGRILMPMQKVVNNLTDELELAARFSSQSQLYVDPKSGLDDQDVLTSDPSRVIIANNPTQNIWERASKGINPVVQQMIDYLLREAQRSTRFADIMTGMKQYASETATSTQNRVLQSSVGIQDKKADVVEAMQWACKSRIKLAMEKWKAPFWARVGEDDASEMVDMPMLNRLPTAIPASPKFVSEFMRENPHLPPPSIELAENADGSAVLADIDFDVRVELGPGMARGKADLYNIILSLMQLQVYEDNKVVPFMSAKKARSLIERYIGIRLTDDETIPGAGNMGVMNANAINPLSPEGQIMMPQGAQTPLPSNLMDTVPGTANMDKRGQIL